ncbi:MAG: hypothetical protein DHS20C17_34790 [Cyclobacteriaceae bacterium]|nr:MAG: hypothetical protein DHS20C17_34790 [Cyclobacteriaceae bacterium]
MEQKIIQLSACALGIILLFSCENDTGPLILDSNQGPVSYGLQIQPIFDAKCIGCHDEIHEQLDLRACCSYEELWSLGTGAPYLDTGVPSQSKLYRHLTGDLLVMPPFGALPNNEIDLVLQWITEGGLDN